MNLPAKTLKDAFNACDPVQPLSAGDERYVDLAAGRGEEGQAVELCRQRILRSDKPLVQLFAGHRGCGKSTELRRLQKALENDGYQVILIEAETDLNLEDTEPTDVLLALLRGFDAGLRKTGIAVSEKLLEELLNWFAEVVLEKTNQKTIEAELRSEAEIGGSVPLLGRLLARFTGWTKTGFESKKNLRLKLEPRISELLSHIRTYIGAARLAVQRNGRRDLVLIIDSLDRIALKTLGDGRSSHEVLFIERGDLLRGLGCHAILTVPISLLFSAKLANLTAIFPHRYVLPMVKLSDSRSGKRWEKGFSLMQDMLASRLDLEALFEDGAVDELIAASGGHPRELLRLIHYALDFVEEPPIPCLAAERAVRKLVNDYDRSIPEEHWPLLARVHRLRKVQNDSTHQLMLFNLSVLEYQNEKRWCDVHPAVQRLDQFQAALKKPRRVKSTG